MDAFQAVSVIALICAIVTVMLLRSWWSVPVAVGGYVLVMLVLASTAQANVRQRSYHYGGGQCIHWRVQEYKDGIIPVPGTEEWHMNLVADWCWRYYGGRYHFRHFRFTHGHREGVAWNWGGWSSFQGVHRHHPNRWVIHTSAMFNGATPTILTEHVYPYVRMTVYPSGARWAVRATCGC